MEDNGTVSSKDDQGNSLEEWTQEKLITRCKNLVAIAQKAKKARDECIEKSKILSDENDKINVKAQKLESDLKTSQEMLARFTEQKLEMSMLVDGLKKERKQLGEDIQKLSGVKEQLEIENISLKRQYTRMITENEDLITQLGEAENRLKNAISLKSDINKIQENNENIKLLCANVTQEKEDLEKECLTLTKKVSSMENKWEKMQQYISNKFNVDSQDVDSWITVISSALDSKVDLKTEDFSELRIKCLEESERSNKLNLELQQAASNLSSAVNERNDLQLELKKYIEMNEHSRNELNLLNEDKDKMMNNLENMRIETRQLIESSEKLSEEIEALKVNKSKVENELSSRQTEKDQLNSELLLKNGEIDRLSSIINSLTNELEVQKTQVSHFESLSQDIVQVKDKLNKELDLNKNLHKKIENLQQQIACFEEKSISNQLEFDKLTELLEKSQSSENQVRSELVLASENLSRLQNKLKELETEPPVNISVIEEKDQLINMIKTELDTLKENYENNEELLSKELERLKFEKEEFKCLVESLREEATENNNKYSKELNETKELLSQSLVREKELFKEFKTNLLVVEECKNKITSDYNEIDKKYNEKCSQVTKMADELLKEKEKTVKLENDVLNVNSQIADINELLTEASKLNQKYENDLKETQNQLSDLIIVNENLKSSLIAKTEFLNQLQSSKDNSVTDIENLNQQLTILQDDLIIKENTICDIRSQFETVNLSCKELKSEVESYKHEIDIKNCEIDKKDKSIINLETELEKLKQNSIELESKFKSITEEYEKLNDTISKDQEAANNFNIIRDTSQKYEEEISSLQSALRERSTELQNCRRTWIGHLTILKGAFFGLKHSYDDLRKSVGDMQDFFKTLSSLTPVNFQEKINHCLDNALQTSKQDLLGEMQHMNQALKQRGEMISKLQISVSEMEKRIMKSSEETKEAETKLFNMSSALEDKEKQLKLKENIIKDLEIEITRYKDNNDSMTEGDMMSTSTISKADESGRLKDLEDSFEEKYTKLKLLAMKLKKRVNELNAALEEEKNRSVSERNELIEKIHSLTSAAKNAQKLQESFDSLMDNYEEQKKKNKGLEQTVQNSSKAQEDLRAEIIKLEAEVKRIPNMKKHIESLTVNVSNAKKELTALQKEKDVEVIKYNELKKDKTKLDEKVAELSSSLEQALQQSRNNNLMELEMNNYVKTIEDLSAQLTAEKEKYVNLRQEMESMNSVKSGLEEQIKLLENQIKIEEERNSLSNSQLTAAKESLAELQSQLSEKSDKCDVLERELQEAKQKYEAMAVQATTVTSQFTVKEKELETQLSSFQRIVCDFESKVSSRDEEILRCQAELVRVQGEFDAYRARAQAVLAKQRSETVTTAEREATEQIDKLNHQIAMLTKKLDTLMSELELMKTEKITYTHEKERCDRRIEELNKIIQYKTSEIDKLNTEFRCFKISTETLKQSFKNELDEKETSYKRMIEDFKLQIEDISNRNKFLESKLDNTGISSINMSEDINLHPDGIEVLPQQREEGEGSESVPSPQNRKRSTNLVPLDVLLNTPYDSESRIGLLCDRISLLEKEVNSYEVRCRHLAGLLSEAERDSARNSQLNTLLKEEIRRLERSLQRQPHAANTEYLKNVIFKFVTLQSGDEKSRLVPVLDTILKLSPEETSKLNAVARGEVGSGWSNYLPSWAGL